MRVFDNYKPRFQDLTRAQAFGLEARVIQRLMPALRLSNDARASDVKEYFCSVIDLTYLLCEIGLGNRPIQDVRSDGQHLNTVLQGYTQVIDNKSMQAADALLCVTDALGDLQLVKYLERPGLAARDRTNPDLQMLVDQGALAFSRIGILEDIFNHPVYEDAKFIFEHFDETEPFLPTAFFKRKLWPNPGLYTPKEGLPPSFRRIIFDEWVSSLTKLGLGGLVASYDGFFSGMHLVKNKINYDAKENSMINNVTLNFGNGSSFTGPIAVGQNIQVSYEAAASERKDQLRQRLEDVVKLVSQLTEAIDSEGRQNDTSAQLKGFIEEAKKEKPSKWMLDITSKGLIEAATTVGAMAMPIANAVKAVLDLVAPNP